MKCPHHATGDHAEECKPGCWLLSKYQSTAPRDSIDYMCPCGCGDLRWLPLRRDDNHAPNHAEWKWDGNEDAPTLTPSIRHLDGCRFHGYLTAGKWTSCGDGAPVHPDANAN